MRAIYKGFISLDKYRIYIIATMFVVALVVGFGIYCCY
jgi:hypothetical protein